MKFIKFTINLDSNKSKLNPQMVGKNGSDWIDLIRDLKGYKLSGKEINEYIDQYRELVKKWCRIVILNENGDIVANDRQLGLEWEYHPGSIETEDAEIYIRQHKIDSVVKKIEEDDDNNL
jgi:hypothetical protein